MTASGFEEYEDVDYDHDTTVDDVADQIYDALIDRDWVGQIGLGDGGMIISDVNGLEFLVVVSQRTATPAKG